jgi:hypothetical protein
MARVNIKRKHPPFAQLMSGGKYAIQSSEMR